MNLFYAPDLEGGIYTLNEEESRHCLKVLRLKAGDSIHLTDGRGGIFEARIVNYTARNCVTEIIANLAAGQGLETEKRQASFGFRPYRLHIAIAPTKNTDRFEWFLEKATEVGIDEITPLICDHSERRNLRTDRLEKIITSAIKQSLKAYHPALHEARSFREFTTSHAGENCYLAHLEESPVFLGDLYQKGKPAVILIGPEGDFSPAEIELAVRNGYRPVSLGPGRLRTETAGVVACSIINSMNWSEK